MYKNGETALNRILELVAKCPKELQEKCFEVLISGYVQLEVGGVKPQAPIGQIQQDEQTQRQTPPDNPLVPPAVLSRFKNTAKRLSVAVEKLEALFDFSVDPFAIHALTLPGKNNAEKTRQVALLAASRSYLALGTWTADWQEVKSMCVDHSCYDGNHVANLKKGEGNVFKSIESKKTIELSSGGVKEAEKLIKILAEESDQ